MKLHDVQQHHLKLTRYLAPTSIDHALATWSQLGGRAQVVAGGTDLLLELTRGQRPGVDTLIDLSRLPEIGSISNEGDHLVVGAGVTHSQAAGAPLVLQHALPLAQACWEVGSPQLRNRATIVGNVVTASPANDTISALRALGTSIEIRSQQGIRSVDLKDFHTGIRETVLQPGEIITALRVRKLGASESGVFVKLGLRRAQAISVVHLTIVIEWNQDRVAAARIALGSVAPTIVSAPAAEEYLVGKPLDPGTVTEAARLAADGVRPIDDLRATAAYRSRAVAVMVGRALHALSASAQRNPWRPPAVTLGGAGPPPTATAADLTVLEPITARVNGQPRTAPGAAGKTLLDWLRDDLALTGSKEGCAEGECGACTVYLDGAAVMACLIPAGRAHGAEVTTIEGLAGSKRLHPLQQAFVSQGAVQCGYCIPGFIMSGAKLLAELPSPSRSEIEAALAGNLCRCTGYYKIIDAVERVARR
ncbi:MAG TPA: FAD binding domain-containing protein [Acidimicrobiia bacterium]|nr:FAD binding domain-containing protein [Acidimicrobiia bacterium]